MYAATSSRTDEINMIRQFVIQLRILVPDASPRAALRNMSAKSSWRCIDGAIADDPSNFAKQD